MATDTNWLYTRTGVVSVYGSRRPKARGYLQRITTRTEVFRIDVRTGQPDLTTRTMAETVTVRPRLNNIWVRDATP
jgi:hypothetical protein